MSKKPRNRYAVTEAEKAIAARLKAALAATGLTQAQAADRLNLSQGRISQWVNAHEPVPADQAEALGALLGLKPEEISLAYQQRKNALDHLRKDIEALHFVVTGMALYITGKTPGEAFALSEEIRKTAERSDFQADGGWVGWIREHIVAAQRTGESAPRPAKAGGGAGASKRPR